MMRITSVRSFRPPTYAIPRHSHSSLAASDRAVCAGAPQLPPATEPFDIVIVNGHIIDGTGSPWYSGRSRHSRRPHRRHRQPRSAPRNQTIDAQGKVVAPGFIDMLGQSELTMLVDPQRAVEDFSGDHHRGHRRRQFRRAHKRGDDRGRPRRLRASAHSRPTGPLSANILPAWNARAWASILPAMWVRPACGAWCSATPTCSPHRINWPGCRGWWIMPCRMEPWACPARSSMRRRPMPRPRS